MTVLKNAGFTDLALEKVGDTTYSYLFDGQRGSLDYVLASASLFPQVAGATVWNINSDEIPLFDYNDDFGEIGEATFERESNSNLIYAPNQLRSSDHDPTLVGLALKSSAAVLATTPITPPEMISVTPPVLPRVTILIRPPETPLIAARSGTMSIPYAYLVTLVLVVLVAVI